MASLPDCDEVREKENTKSQGQEYEVAERGKDWRDPNITFAMHRENRELGKKCSVF